MLKLVSVIVPEISARPRAVLLKTKRNFMSLLVTKPKRKQTNCKQSSSPKSFRSLTMFRLLFFYLYPAYCTFKAFKSKKAVEYVKWMQFWIVFALFTVIETITDIVFFWVPFYDEIKTLMLIFLIVPVWKGSLGSGVIYRKILHPFLVSNEDKIDVFIEKITGRVLNFIKNCAFRAFRFVSDSILNSAGAAMITTPLPPAAANQNLMVMSSDSEGDEQSKTVKPKPKSLKKRKVTKK